MATNGLLGKVPYLNGGLFLRHQIEEKYGKDIQIPDVAFEKLFVFFDEYQWHLDERPLRDDREINPDVLGYIFEKYINQKQMGAYYTKEDITGYISQNTIIPFLLDAARQKCKIAFEDKQSVWRLLQADPDRYFYDAVKHGVALALPEEIAEGLKDVSKRSEWNKAGPTDYALPTETWRELVARRSRYEEMREKLASGEIREISDLITYNLNIRQFAQDMIENSEGPELLRAFWHGIEKVTVLDPTVGSGAFLFAALNVLEPLYEACLDRMQVFVDELERSGERYRPEKFADFKQVLARIETHPNRRYFVLKSIVINNLYGVDIMEEATEICKLRLFLKLVAQVDTVDKIEPLPDIDFNIRAGNSLVGFATYDQVKKAVLGDGQAKMDFGNDMQRIDESAEVADRAFKKFREMQTERGMGAKDFADAKHELRQRLSTLEDELNRYLATEYGIDLKKQTAYQQWLESHSPFHWFVEYYSILKQGGFDVVIGNPPYVEYNKVKEHYTVHNYETESCDDLYSFVLERSIGHLLQANGRVGAIVPVSWVSTDGFEPLQRFLLRHCNTIWASNYAERPAKLFTGVEKRLNIMLASRSGPQNAKLLLSKYHRWHAEERAALFERLAYADVTALYSRTSETFRGSIPKVGTTIELRIMEKLMGGRKSLQLFLLKSGAHRIFYTRKLRYFIQFFDFVPRIVNSRGKVERPSELKDLFTRKAEHREASLATLNSSLFFWFFVLFSDCRNVNRREILNFPVDLDELCEKYARKLGGCSAALMEDFARNSSMLSMRYEGRGTLQIQTFQPRKSKPIIDEIDRVLANHYGFTEEELDFIVNYDIKYRMGRDAEEEGEWSQ